MWVGIEYNKFIVQRDEKIVTGEQALGDNVQLAKLAVDPFVVFE